MLSATHPLGFPPPYVFALSAVALLTYLWVLWRVLRQERPLTRLLLLLVMLAAFAVRMHAFPPQHIDAALTLGCTADDYREGRLFDDNCNRMPSLIHILFQFPLVHVFGPDTVATGAYSMFGSCLAIALSFGLVRTMGGHIAGAFLTATAMATVPWLIFHARLYQGGEIILNQLLLLLVLARAVWRRTDPFDVWAGAMALTLAMYSYWPARSMVSMPFVAFVLARGWRNRASCLLIFLLGVSGAVPLLLGNAPDRWTGLASDGIGLDEPGRDYTVWTDRLSIALRTTFDPNSDSGGWLSIRSGGVQPMLLLGLALLGTATSARRFLFLWPPFLAGLLPAVAGFGGVSTHRLICSYSIIPIAAGLTLDLVRRRRARWTLALLAAAWIGYRDLAIYFGPTYQAEMELWYDADATALVRALPSDAEILAYNLEGFIDARALELQRVGTLHLDNWLSSGVVHAFGIHGAIFADLYADLLGSASVHRYGSLFWAFVPSGAWDSARQNGWRYTRTCGQDTRSIVVPTLWYETVYGCPTPAHHVWEATWRGESTVVAVAGKPALQMTIDGATHVVDAPGKFVEFHLNPGSRIRAEIVGSGETAVAMLVGSVKRVPFWREAEAALGGQLPP